MNHDPKVTTEYLDAEGFMVSRQDDDGYQLKGHHRRLDQGHRPPARHRSTALVLAGLVVRPPP